jgi:hypothetical protein
MTTNPWSYPMSDSFLATIAAVRSLVNASNKTSGASDYYKNRVYVRKGKKSTNVKTIIHDDASTFRRVVKVIEASGFTFRCVNNTVVFCQPVKKAA